MLKTVNDSLKRLSSGRPDVENVLDVLVLLVSFSDLMVGDSGCFEEYLVKS